MRKQQQQCIEAAADEVSNFIVTQCRWVSSTSSPVVDAKGIQRHEWATFIGPVLQLVAQKPLIKNYYTETPHSVSPQQALKNALAEEYIKMSHEVANMCQNNRHRTNAHIHGFFATVAARAAIAVGNTAAIAALTGHNRNFLSELQLTERVQFGHLEGEGRNNLSQYVIDGIIKLWMEFSEESPTSAHVKKKCFNKVTNLFEVHSLRWLTQSVPALLDLYAARYPLLGASVGSVLNYRPSWVKEPVQTSCVCSVCLLMWDLTPWFAHNLPIIHRFGQLTLFIYFVLLLFLRH